MSILFFLYKMYRSNCRYIKKILGLYNSFTDLYRFILEVNCNMEAKNAREEDYKSEYDKIPECVEKLILKLILYLQGCTSIVGEIIFVDTIEQLKKSLKDEELDTTRNLELVERAKDSAQVTSSESIEPLEELLGNIRDIDIQRLIALVEKNDKAIEIIREKNIYFFMGLTGHGKSTTIHYLAGSRFEKYNEDGKVRLFAGARPHFQPVRPRVNARNLEFVTTSPYPESDTHSIIPVVINLDGGEAILCDSPGFDDTCVELDIANSLLIENAIKQCSGVKPIVVISKNMGEKMKGYRFSLLIDNIYISYGIRNFLKYMKLLAEIELFIDTYRDQSSRYINFIDLSNLS